MKAAVIRPAVLSDPFLTWGIAASMLLHVILVIFLLWGPSLQQPGAPEIPIMVDLAFEPPPRKMLTPPDAETRSSPQIVSPPANSQEPAQPPKEAYLSDRDAYTPKEQIHRGSGEDAGIPGKGSLSPPAPKPQAPPSQKALMEQPKQPQREAAQSKPPKSLRLDDETLRDAFSENKERNLSLDEKVQAAVLGRSPENSAQAGLRAYQPFSRPFGTGARFLGNQGSTDYLPNLPDGDITLLNTKADRFAVFVRRVATQVFAEIRSSGWEYLHPGDIKAMTQESTVLAVLSPQGKLLRVALDTPSGSRRFDELLLQAARVGVKDPNPPPAAAKEDGNIHFIFKSKCWVDFVAHPRTGGRAQRRWLLLATGLD